VIDALKTAFVSGRLTRDKFDAGVGQALTSRTYAELAMVTADIPTRPARAQPCRQDSAASATPPVLAGQMTRGSSIARTVRARRWPGVLVAGLVLMILGITLVPSEPRPGVILLGVMIALQAAARGLVRWPSDRERRRVWEIPPTYGLAPSYDDVDLEKMAQETLEETTRSVLGDNAPVTLRVERGHPAPILITASEHAQLLVAGSQGHGAFADMLLGSVSQHCVHQAHCPVVVIRRPKGEPRPGG
jgi:nucleotide-binding universal stress UspA family protein